MRALIGVGLILLLAACRRDELAYVQGKVHSIGAATLIAGASRLAIEHPETADQLFVDPSTLPTSFRVFAPVETLRYGRSFFIVTARSLQHRVGVFVQPVDSPEPEKSPIATYTKLAAGIYFCST